MDARFLDVDNLWEYLSQVHAAVACGGFFGSILPPVNQVINLVADPQSSDFGSMEMEELLLSPYKTVSARLRPEDRLCPPTGYLVFARKLLSAGDRSWET